MALFEQALAMFNPFGKPLAKSSSEKPMDKSPGEPGAEQGEPYSKSDIEEMKRQLDLLQKRIEGLASKE
jgi:polyhydroxyalkanoate synthesis regulator protein